MGDGFAGVDGGEEVGEGVGQALLRGDDGGPEGGAEQPEVGGAESVGSDADGGEGVVWTEECGEALGVEEGAEFGELLEEVIGRRGGDAGGAGAAEGEGLKMAATGSAADAKIDAVGEDGVEGAKDLGDFERGVVLEHDAAGSDTDAGGFGGGSGDEDLGRGAGEHVHGVVLGVPEAGVAEAVDVAGEVEGVSERLRGCGAGRDGGLVENGETERETARGGCHACSMIAVGSA